MTGLSTLSYKRKIKVHYTIFDKEGKELHGGAAIVYMPPTTNDMNKIINNYFPILAQNMSENIPGAQTSKLDQEKLKEEERKAKEQREDIEKL
jgi:triosephosphate isomerase